MKGIFVSRPVQPIGLPFGQPTNGIRLSKATSPSLFFGDKPEAHTVGLYLLSPCSAISIPALNYQRGKLETNPGQTLI